MTGVGHLTAVTRSRALSRSCLRRAPVAFGLTFSQSSPFAYAQGRFFSTPCMHKKKPAIPQGKCQSLLAPTALRFGGLHFSFCSHFGVTHLVITGKRLVEMTGVEPVSKDPNQEPLQS